MPTAQDMHILNSSEFADAFKTYLSLPATLDPPLEESLRHVLDNPGSLVRPRMIFRLATAYGIEEMPARELAIALEYFHTASLVFDDLPSMDNAQERRGVPCVHFAFGEAARFLLPSASSIARMRSCGVPSPVARLRCSPAPRPTSSSASAWTAC